MSPRAPTRPEVLRQITAQVEQILDSLEPLARGFAEVVGSADDARPVALSSLRDLILGMLEAHVGLVAGAGAIAEPGTMPESRYWMEWWWTRASGAPEALRVNLDPEAPDFFDYTSADWYATPKTRSARHVSGPYVDYACTNEYALTLGVPVTVGGRFAGVAAADVLVSSLERQLLPALRSLTRPAVLLNGGGRVIASTSPDFASGMRVPLPRPGGSVNGSEPSQESLPARPIDWHLVLASSLR